MKVYWTKEAYKQLINIEKYIASDNPDAAERFTNSLIQKAETLITYPEKGRIVPEFSIRSVRELVLKNYRIVYMIREKRIEIITVFEATNY